MRYTNAQKLRKNAEEAASLLKACANAERLMILCNLIGGEQSVTDLLEKSELSQSAFSQHLAVLRSNGLVKTRKEMQVVYYSLADERATTLLEVMYELFC